MRPYRLRPLRFCVPLFAALLASTPVWAGVAYSLETTDADGKIERQEISVDGGKIAMKTGLDISGNAQGGMIFRGDQRRMIVVDNDKRTYMILDVKTVEGLGGEVQGAMQTAMQELEKQLQDVPEEQRAMVEKMIKGQLEDLKKIGAPQKSAEPPAEIVRTEQSETWNDLSCEIHEVRVGGVVESSLCIVPRDSLPGGDEAAEAFGDLAEFGTELLNTFRESAPALQGMMGKDMLRFDNPFERIRQLNGFPVIVRHFEDDQMDSETVLDSVVEREFDAADFEPPAGYKQREMMR